MKNKSESIVVVIFVLILITILVITFYTIYSSSNSLSSNKSNIQNTVPNIPENNTTNNGNNATNNEKPIIKEKETEIAIFSSNIYDKDENRVYNIGLAIKKINGKVVKKGETFSFNETVGPMGEKQGYKEATGFDTNGKVIKVFGGGMCQISSTIYNTALISNLEIIERHPHSKRVYYVPKDKDATIYYNTLDLKFKNTTENDIKIIATNDKSNVTIKFNKITFE
ncbi:MAG: VanW family protein [Clostridia bacterium]